jgi:hypothetical protein
MKFIIYTSALIGLFIIITLAYYFYFINLQDIARSALALVGTFFGATFAFRLNQSKESFQLHLKRRESLNRAIFILIRQYNAVHHLKNEFSAFSKPIEKAFKLRAVTPPPYQDLYHNFENIEFILESKNPHIIFDLSIEQERFHQIMAAINFRNEFFIKEVMPAAANADLDGKLLSARELQEKLGDRIYYGAIQGVEEAEKILILGNESLPKMLKSLRDFAKEQYPKHSFINYEIPA